MILIEICEAVVEEDRRIHIFRDVEGQGALYSWVMNGCYKVARVIGIRDILPHPCCCDRTIAAERPRDKVGRHRSTSIYGGIRGTSRVVYLDLFDLFDGISVSEREYPPFAIFDYLTSALAYSRAPPMGPNMIPTAKKRGRTVLGVRMGLRFISI